MSSPMMSSASGRPESGPGWPLWALLIFTLAALGLCAAGAIVALRSTQPGTLVLGLVGAAIGALFIITTPGWDRGRRI